MRFSSGTVPWWRIILGLSVVLLFAPVWLASGLTVAVWRFMRFGWLMTEHLLDEIIFIE